MDTGTYLTEHPEIVISTLGGIILPIALVWLNNHYALKRTEKETALSRELKYDDEHVNHERIIHSSMVKILFEIQRLYISLSCDPEREKECIRNATKDFQENFAKHQSVISNNQIFLNSFIIGRIYKFYNSIAEILIELNKIQSCEEVEGLAKVCVYNRSQELADIILEIQRPLIEKRKELYGELELIESELEEFRTCCGPAPHPELQKRYNQVIQQINESSEPISF